MCLPSPHICDNYVSAFTRSNIIKMQGDDREGDHDGDHGNNNDYDDDDCHGDDNYGDGVGGGGGAVSYTHLTLPTKIGV